MKIPRIILSALASVAALTAISQTAPGPANAPATSPVTTTLPTPTLPSGQPQRQGLRPNQLSNPQSSTSQVSGTPVTAVDVAVTPADQALLGQVHQTVVTRVQGAGAFAPVHFQVQNGVVTILGNVPDATLVSQIEAAVQQTPGVVSVVNQLTTNGGQQAMAIGRQDQTLLTRVRQAVTPQIQIAGAPIPVSFMAQQGVVTITGVVPTIQQKHQIFALVQQVPGVVQVNDLVKVGTATGLSQGSLNATTGSATVPNLTPTGPTNSTALPPGLAGRTDLPPGLERRAVLPPGLAAGTNGLPR